MSDNLKTLISRLSPTMKKAMEAAAATYEYSKNR